MTIMCVCVWGGGGRWGVVENRYMHVQCAYLNYIIIAKNFVRNFNLAMDSPLQISVDLDLAV